ncbi:MAG: STAS domain-containing protein [Gammaproteobacteria bacterium]|nr:STAS domain-containing protein [Gammaproteobacteria bacterium]
MTLETSLINSGGTLLVKLPTTFDIGIHKEFRALHADLDSNVKDFAIDFVDTQHMDSSALGMLLLLRDELSSGSTDISLINCSDNIKELLKLARFDTLFTVK